ncbi:MAG: glycosyl hydrolase family 8, partial [Desulfonatronovibrio sp.]
MKYLFSIALLSFLILLMAAPVRADVCSDWNVFKARFLTSDGRIIDRFQNNISHSEGQGYAMIMAALCNEPDIFDSLWKWTRDNLQVRRTDSLLVWSWGERFPEQWTVLDYNNATDGDILVAWALLLGAEQWPDSSYNTEALKLIKSIRNLLGIERHGRLMLLPGYQGFIEADTIRLNPSYFIFSAFEAFAQEDDQDFWNTVRDDSLDLLKSSLIPPLM